MRQFVRRLYVFVMVVVCVSVLEGCATGYNSGYNQCLMQNGPMAQLHCQENYRKYYNSGNYGSGYYGNGPYYPGPMSILQQQNAWRQQFGYGGGYGFGGPFYGNGFYGNFGYGGWW